MAKSAEMLEQALADLQQLVGISRGSGQEGQLAQPLVLPEFSHEPAQSSAESPASTPPAGARRRIRIELGRARLTSEMAANLRSGTLVPLDRAASDPVDLLVDGRPSARGELLNMNGRLCVRICQIVSRRDGGIS